MKYHTGSFLLSLEEYSEDPNNQAIVTLDEGGFASLDVLYACMAGIMVEPTLPGLVPAIIEAELPQDLSELENLRVKNALREIYKNIKKELRAEFSKSLNESSLEYSEEDLMN